MATSAGTLVARGRWAAFGHSRSRSPGSIPATIAARSTAARVCTAAGRVAGELGGEQGEREQGDGAEERRARRRPRPAGRSRRARSRAPPARRRARRGRARRSRAGRSSQGARREVRAAASAGRVWRPRRESERPACGVEGEGGGDPARRDRGGRGGKERVGERAQAAGGLRGRRTGGELRAGATPALPTRLCPQFVRERGCARATRGGRARAPFRGAAWSAGSRSGRSDSVGGAPARMC